MDVTILNLVPGTLLPTDETIHFTTEESQTAAIKNVIDKCLVINTSAARAWVKAHIVPEDGAVGNDNIILPETIIEPGEAYHCPEIVGAVLEEGYSFVTLAQTADVLNLTVYGRLVSYD